MGGKKRDLGHEIWRKEKEPGDEGKTKSRLWSQVTVY